MRLVATALARARCADADAALSPTSAGPLRAPAVLSTAVLLLRLSCSCRRRRREGRPRRALRLIAGTGTIKATTILERTQTVYLGGGTPSLVEPHLIKQLLDAIDEKHGIVVMRKSR